MRGRISIGWRRWSSPDIDLDALLAWFGTSFAPPISVERLTRFDESEPGHFVDSSSLSYYTLFSLAPLLIIVIAIAGLAFGREAAEHQIVGTIQGMVGEQSAQAIQGMIQNASSQPKTGILSAVIGVVTLILGAGGVVGQLQTSLNTIWGVTPKPEQGVWGFVRQRFISLQWFCPSDFCF